MSLLEHADSELRLAGFNPDSKDFFSRTIYKNIMEIVKAFSGQGHSGGSAEVVTGILGSLLAYKPLSPLTGEDSEWNTQNPGFIQNVRLSSVFKDPKTGECYDIDGIVFEEPNGVRFGSGQWSRVPVTFPYTQNRRVVKVPFNCEDLGKYV